MWPQAKASDTACLIGSRDVQVGGSVERANVCLGLTTTSGDARFYGANGEKTLSFSGLPYTATIYGQATSSVLDGITLTATMTSGGTAQAAVV